MNNERELLELAAKAAGMRVPLDYDANAGLLFEHGEGYWNPLTDDGDALRLAVKLDIDLEFLCPGVEAYRSYNHEDSADRSHYCAAEQEYKDPHAATRRVIVRAAAEIGRNMK